MNRAQRRAAARGRGVVAWLCDDPRCLDHGPSTTREVERANLSPNAEEAPAVTEAPSGTTPGTTGAGHERHHSTD